MYLFFKYGFKYIHTPVIMAVYIPLEWEKLSLPLRIQGWPGIAGFAVGVAIVMKAPKISRSSFCVKIPVFFDACSKSNPDLFEDFWGKQAILGILCLTNITAIASYMVEFCEGDG